jgi:hypothetical protein
MGVSLSSLGERGGRRRANNEEKDNSKRKVDPQLEAQLARVPPEVLANICIWGGLTPLNIEDVSAFPLPIVPLFTLFGEVVERVV